MTMLLFTTLGAALMMIAYALGLGGPVSGLIVLGGALNGALISYARPLLKRETKT